VSAYDCHYRCKNFTLSHCRNRRQQKLLAIDCGAALPFCNASSGLPISLVVYSRRPLQPIDEKANDQKDSHHAGNSLPSRSNRSRARLRHRCSVRRRGRWTVDGGRWTTMTRGRWIVHAPSVVPTRRGDLVSESGDPPMTLVSR